MTLAELASHRSGLFGQGMQLDDTIPFLLRYVRHQNPFTQDVDEVPTIIWFTAVALLAGGVVGAVLRWTSLAWLSSTHPTRRAIRVGLTLLSCTLIVGVAVI